MLLGRAVRQRDQEVAVREHDALAAAIGVDPRSPRIGPLQFTARAPFSFAPDGVDGPAGRLIGGKLRTAVVYRVPERQHGARPLVPFGHDIAHALLDPASERDTPQRRHGLRLGPRAAEIGRGHCVDGTKIVRARDRLQRHEYGVASAVAAGNDARPRVKPRRPAAITAAPQRHFFNARDRPGRIRGARPEGERGGSGGERSGKVAAGDRVGVHGGRARRGGGERDV